MACQLTTKVAYLTRTVFDHSPLLLQLERPRTPSVTSEIWRLYIFWLTILNGTRILAALTENVTFNSVAWDAMKAFLRGVFYNILVLSRPSDDH